MLSISLPVTSWWPACLDYFARNNRAELSFRDPQLPASLSKNDLFIYFSTSGCRIIIFDPGMQDINIFYIKLLPMPVQLPFVPVMRE